MVYAAVGVSGSQKGNKFRVMDRLFIGPFNITVRQSIFVGVGGRKSQNNGLFTGALFFLLPSSRASLKMPRWHRLAHKAPVMQAIVECTCTAKQKNDLALYATRRHNRWRHCDCQPVTSSIVASSCITVSKQHHYQWVQRPKCSFILCEKCLCWLFILGDEMFTAGKSLPILLMQILYNAVKRLIFFKCDELS